MHFRPIILCACVAFFAGCGPRLENNLAGNWRSCLDGGGCGIITLKSDHTFSERFDRENSSETYRSGTWRLEGDQLVLHITWAMEPFQGLIGQEDRQIISEFRRDAFVTKTAVDTTPVAFKRVP
jgi:hypothetical protein